MRVGRCYQTKSMSRPTHSLIIVSRDRQLSQVLRLCLAWDQTLDSTSLKIKHQPKISLVTSPSTLDSTVFNWKYLYLSYCESDLCLAWDQTLDSTSLKIKHRRYNLSTLNITVFNWKYLYRLYCKSDLSNYFYSRSFQIDNGDNECLVAWWLSDDGA